MDNTLQQKIEELKAENEMLKEQLHVTKKELSEKLQEISYHHQEMKDSVNYARRIQSAIQPPTDYINTLLPQNYVLYLPKDVVSGDFYFVEANNDKVVFSAVDCTGHGIPGAMMSVVGFNYLDAAVKTGVTKPCDVLHYLDKGVNDMLRQTGGESGVNDGMDLALCSLEKTEKGAVLEYAGAYNSLYIISKSNNLKDITTFMEKDEVVIHDPKHQLGGFSLYEIKADKFPIGVNTDGVADFYTNHRIQLNQGDQVILFSDGYADQFGGPQVEKGGKKYKYKTLRMFLLSIVNLCAEEQKVALVNEFNRWKGELEQVDDVLIMGVRV